MRTLFCTILAALLLLAFFNGSCGNSRSPTGTACLTEPMSAVEPDAATVERPDPFTEEDRMVMAMPLEDRIAYLEKKLKDMLFQRYGIVVEECALDVKDTSLVDDFNKVCTGTSKEQLDLVQTTDPSNKWEWTLSFYQRLSGDYDFDNVVTADDIDPIGANFGHKKGDEWYDLDAHIDRLANDDGEISIADITPIAINFGHSMYGDAYGYSVYWQDSTGGDWKLIAEESDGVRNSNQNAPDDYSYIFTKKSIYRNTSPHIINETSSGNDLIRVKPVFYSGEQDIPSETDTFAH